MAKLLEENHIALLEFAKRWERKQGNGKPEHALSAWVKPISDCSVSDSPSDISEPEASIPSLKNSQSVHQSFLPKLVMFH